MDVTIFLFVGGAEVEQGEAEGEGEQHGPVWPGDLRQASIRGAEVQAHHSFHSLWSLEGNFSVFLFHICVSSSLEGVRMLLLVPSDRWSVVFFNGMSEWMIIGVEKLDWYWYRGNLYISLNPSRAADY